MDFTFQKLLKPIRHVLRKPFGLQGNVISVTDCGRLAGVIISETADLLGFSQKSL